MTATSLCTAPDKVDLRHYAGDTLTLHVSFPPGFPAGRQWSAQVRKARTDPAPAAEFRVVAGATADDPITLVLSAADCAALCGDQPAWQGVWDVQLAPPGGGDPVVTVAQGGLSLLKDVTR